MNRNEKYHQVLDQLVRIAESRNLNLDDADIIIITTDVGDDQIELRVTSVRGEITVDAKGNADLEEITYRTEVYEVIGGQDRKLSDVTEIIV